MAESAEAATASEAAFAALVDRHGAMVWGVCRRVLGDVHEAEDAFQATFLILVRKSGTVRVQGSLGRWLYGVAHRVALRAGGGPASVSRDVAAASAPAAEDPARETELTGPAQSTGRGTRSTAGEIPLPDRALSPPGVDVPPGGSAARTGRWPRSRAG